MLNQADRRALDELKALRADSIAADCIAGRRCECIVRRLRECPVAGRIQAAYAAGNCVYRESADAPPISAAFRLTVHRA